MKTIITTESKEKEILDNRCDEVNIKTENNLVRQIILDLKNTIREKDKCVGLSANQIGYDKRIFCINFNGDIRTFINPIIAQAKGLTLSREGCMSVPKKEYLIPRNNEISVHYLTPLGKVESRKMFGYAACVFQHELNHLDGALISDIGLEITEEFDKASQEEKDELINLYLESLDLKAKELSKEVQEDPELKKIDNAIKFNERLAKGEITVERYQLSEEEIAKQKGEGDGKQ